MDEEIDYAKLRKALKNANMKTVARALANPYDPEEELEELEYLIYPLILKGQLGCVFGDSGCGKSTLAMKLAAALAIGNQKIGDMLTYSPKKVLYLDYELGKQSIRKRTPQGIPENLIIQSVDNYLYQGSTNGEDKVQRRIEFIIETAKYYGVEVIIVDNLSNVADDIEQAKDADQFIAELYAQMKHFKLTILFVGHTPKLPRAAKMSANHLKGSSSIAKTMEVLWGFHKYEKNKTYLIQLKNRDVDLIYDEDNVCLFDYDPEKGHLEYAGVAVEDELLQTTGNRGGRPSTITDSTKAEVIYARQGGLTVSKTAAKFKISETSVKNIGAEFKQDEALKKYYKDWKEKKEISFKDVDEKNILE